MLALLKWRRAVCLMVAWAGLTYAQAPVRQDSVSVSAGLSKEQLAAEGKLDEVLQAGRKALTQGDVAGGIATLEKARDMVAANKLLAEQEDTVLGALGNAYLRGQRFADGEHVFTRQLEIHKADCEAGSADAASCADVQ